MLKRIQGTRKEVALSLLACLLIGVPLYWLESTRLQNFNVDWNIAFYPATRLLLHGQNPYAVPYFHNPVWALIPLVPCAMLGQQVGGLLLFFFTLFTFAFMGLRFKAKPVALVALLLSPLLFYNLFLGNIDALVLWALLLPPPVGLFLVALKPQVGIGIAAYLAFTSWRDGGWRKLLWTVAPVILGLGVSFLVFGNWMTSSSEDVLSAYWNLSLFPWSVPVGLLVLAVALWRHRETISASASPFLAPYVSLGSWSIALLGLLDSNLLMVGIVFGLWLLYLLNSFLGFHPVFGP